MAEKLNLQINIAGKEQTISSVRELQKAIKAAEFEAFALTEQFGESDDRVIEIRKQVGSLKNAMADATDQAKAFSQDSQFPAVAQAVRGVASGFTAVQGTMALIGVEGEAVEKTLLKVQSALAISEGLGGVIDSIDAFKNLGSLIKSTTAFRYVDVAATKIAAATQRLFTGAVTTTSTAFKGLKAAIVSTGIGALVVGLGIIISKMMEWADSTEDVEKATERLNKDLERTKEITDENLKFNEFNTKVELANAKIRGASQNELLSIEKNSAKERNKILWDDVKQKEQIVDNLKKQRGVTQEQTEKANKELRESNKRYNDAVAQDQLKALEGQADRSEKAREKGKANRDKAQQEEEQARKDKEARELAAFEVQRETFLNLQTERNRELIQVEQEYEEQRKTLLRANITDFAAIDEALRIKKNEINKKYDEQDAKDIKEKEEDEKKRLQGLLDALKTAKEKNEDNLIELGIKTAKTTDEIRKAEIVKIEKDYERKIAAAKKSGEDIVTLEKLKQAEIDLVNKKVDEEDKKRKKEKLDQQIASYEAVSGALGTFNNLLDMNTKMQVDRAKAEGASEEELTRIQDKNFKLRKTIATAQALIDTFLGVTKVIKNETTLPQPFATIEKVASIATILASGFMAIRNIKKAGGGSGGGGGDMSSASPMTPQAATPQLTQLNQASINAIGNQAIRAYVIETDVTSNQQRVAAIKQRARFN